MTFTLPVLPYSLDALEPHISARTMELHHTKHNKAYVDKANELSKGTPIEGMSVVDAVIASRKQGIGPLFNNIGQMYNHEIFWQSLSPKGGSDVGSAGLADAIKRDFGGLDAFREKFVAEGMGQFGSGWVWLAASGGQLEILKSGNAESPLTEGKMPLIGCDVWEHAYYLDYQNRRLDYLKAFAEKLINWEFAAKGFEQSLNMKAGSCGTSCGCG